VSILIVHNMLENWKRVRDSGTDNQPMASAKTSLREHGSVVQWQRQGT
jgi:hypothetical protein